MNDLLWISACSPLLMLALGVGMAIGQAII